MQLPGSFGEPIVGSDAAKVWQSKKPNLSAVDDYNLFDPWHDSKRQASQDRWLSAIRWIQKSDFVPVGFGRLTKLFVH